jgi:serine/threonine protein kinase
VSEQTIFLAALEITDSAERSAYLDRATAGDETLRRQVESLLDAHERSGGFLDVPACEQMAAGVSPPGQGTAAVAANPPGGSISDAVLAALGGHERYRVVRPLGRGGMGVVYEAEHRVMRRPVALKVINRRYTADAAAAERFRREVRAAARLHHPNIVTAFDAENVGDTHFLVMEYVEGKSLARVVKDRGPLPVQEACDYVRQAALGLQHAHERGMVHRDVKPDNLMLTPDGTVKVLDFGLAALTAEREVGVLTEASAVMGTPDYMAPEQAEDAHSADIRADVYSLGCTLYFLLTGSVPYPAQKILQKILAHRQQPLPSIRQKRPEVPPELGAVVARMLAKKPEDRYQTPAEVAAVLTPFAHPPTAQPPQKRHQLPVALALAAMLALLVLAGVVYRIQTDNGELVITTESDDVEVVIKQGGKQIDIIDAQTDKQIKLALRSGEYELELKGAPEGLKLNIDKATLTRGKKVLAKIERVVVPAEPGVEPRPGQPLSPGDRAKLAACLAETAAAWHRGQYHRMIVECTEALRLDPTCVDAYRWREQAYRLLGDYWLAIRDTEAWLRVSPRDGQAYQVRSWNHIMLRNYQQAIAAATEAIRLEPQRAMAYHHRGWALANVGKLEEALADLDKAADLAPGEARTFICRSLVHERLGNAVKAKADRDKAFQLDADIARSPEWTLPRVAATKP